MGILVFQICADFGPEVAGPEPAGPEVACRKFQRMTSPLKPHCVKEIFVPTISPWQEESSPTDRIQFGEVRFFRVSLQKP